jgi:predicted O-methyltransferase YrrM
MTEKLEDYILSHIDKETPHLEKLNRETHLRLVNPRMMSGHLQGRILKMLCRMIQPKMILELGTFSGYSALCLAEGSDDATIHTIEHNDELEEMIQNFFSESDYKNRIKLHIGDALEIIQTLEEVFDLVFIDADKRQYLEYYEAVLPKVRKGGFIFADNTLWAGKVVQPLQQNDKQTEAILKFNDFIANDQRVEKVILPLRDGLTILMKK